MPSYSHPQKGQPYTTDHSSVTLPISQRSFQCQPGHKRWKPYLGLLSVGHICVRSIFGRWAHFVDGAAASTFYVGNRGEKGTVEIRKKCQWFTADNFQDVKIYLYQLKLDSGKEWLSHLFIKNKKVKSKAESRDKESSYDYSLSAQSSRTSNLYKTHGIKLWWVIPRKIMYQLTCFGSKNTWLGRRALNQVQPVAKHRVFIIYNWSGWDPRQHISVHSINEINSLSFLNYSIQASDKLQVHGILLDIVVSIFSICKLNNESMRDSMLFRVY